MSDGFIMDCKPEERIAQTIFSPVFEVDDLNSNCSTLTAPEAHGSQREFIPTPSLLCKLKKCRIRVKRLPRHIVAKYNSKSNSTTTHEAVVPKRTSKRLDGRALPGKYLALHVNKPLNKVLNKKARLDAQLKVTSEFDYFSNKNCKGILDFSNNISKESFTWSPTDSRKSNTNFAFAKRLGKEKKMSHIASAKDVQLSERTSSFSNLPTVTNYSDLVITKYAMPNSTSTNLPISKSLKSSSSYIGNTNHHIHKDSSTPTVSLNSNASNHHVMNNFNVRNNAISRLCGNTNTSQKLTSMFPKENTLTSLNSQNRNQLIKKNDSTVLAAIEKVITRPTPNCMQNDAVIVDPPKVLVINQPAQKNDPLHLLGSQTIRKSYSDNKIDIESEPDVEGNVKETVKSSKLSPESEVIKRIIYHSKYAQTKFTCSGNICGLVDTDSFNLNCFYCYEIFPLHKWMQFKDHIKMVHHIEENEIESSDESPPISPTIIAASCNARHTQTDLKTIKTSSDKESNVSRRDETIGVGNSNTLVNSNKFRGINNAITSLDGYNNDDDEEDIEFNDLIQNMSDEDSDVSMESCSRNTKLNIIKPTSADTTIGLPQSLQNVTITKINAVRCSPDNSPNKNASEETFIKLPSNLNIQQVLKTIPKSAGQNGNSDGSKKPRYFVVKKVINPVINKTKLNVPTNVVLRKVPPLRQYDNDDDDMPSNDENEDLLPKPTNGCGILFGLTNRMVVIEFLLKLKTFPELWRPQVQKNVNVDYNESIKQLCDHLNNRFTLGIKDFEMRLSIQRVKDWYCRMLKNIHEHNKSHKNSEPYPHKFPVYFKILNQYLSSDVHYANNLLLSSRFKSDTSINHYPKWMVYKTGNTKPESQIFKGEDTETNDHLQPLPVNQAPCPANQPLEQSPNKNFSVEANKVSSQTSTQPSTQSNTPPTTPPTTPLSPELNDDAIIEFDADTLYGNESSEEEVLEEFDETKKESDTADYRRERKRTKVYLGHFACDICNKVFKRNCDLDRHKVHHFPPKYQCALCSKKYYFQHWAERCSHLRKGPGEKDKDAEGNSETMSVEPLIKVKPKWPKKIFRFRLICETCGASYRSIGSLNAHKKDKHLNQRLRCGVCNFTAITNYRIVQHQKKRHIVEPGTVEEVAKKSRARTDTKTPFSVEARQEFDWRREMRKKLRPGEKFYGCCKCRIVFQTRKEKILHNKTEHPIKETTVLCLLCLPEKMLLSNSNSCRRHYTDIHKVPWDEIDALVKRTKPVFNFLTKEQIELLNASENYIELLKKMLDDTKLEEVKKEEVTQDDIDEATKAILNLAQDVKGATLMREEVSKVEVEEPTDDNVYIDGIIDHDYNNDVNEEEFNEHNFIDNHGDNQNPTESYFSDNDSSSVCVKDQKKFIQQHDIDVDVDVDVDNEDDGEGSIRPIAYHIECHNEEEFQDDENQNIGEFVGGELVEECIVVEEECIDDVIDEDEYY